MYNDPNAQPPYGQPPYSQPSGPYQQQPNYGTQQPYPPYGAQQPYPPTAYGQQPLPQKKSNKGVWIGCGIALLALLLVGGVCGGFLYFGYLKGSQVVNSVNNTLGQVEATATADQATTIADEPAPQQQAESYYQAIQAQQYTTAYTYMDSNVVGADGKPLTEARFNEKAQALDSSKGVVTHFVVTVDPNDSTKISVQVSRQGGQTYTVQMTFKQNSSAWVISSFSNI